MIKVYRETSNAFENNSLFSFKTIVFS